MRIGYACLTVNIPNHNYKSCTLKNATEERLLTLIEHNLDVLDRMIDYNILKNIELFRITSSLIPFGSLIMDRIKWWEIFVSKLSSIGEKIKESKMRVTMHPGQYTVLNSPNEEVVSHAIKDLEYHHQVLESLQVNQTGKLILHIGGIYQNKELAMQRFIDNFKKLPRDIKKRIVIENDDKLFNIKDVLNISKIINVPVVYDVLHNELNSFDRENDDNFWIKECKKTWKKKDGVQKIHYSEQDPLKSLGSHSQTIDIIKFEDFINKLTDHEIDIMLEVKDKNESTLKCLPLIKSLSKK